MLRARDQMFTPWSGRYDREARLAVKRTRITEIPSPLDADILKVAREMATLYGSLPGDGLQSI